jgi:hypothetical protein
MMGKVAEAIITFSRGNLNSSSVGIAATTVPPSLYIFPPVNSPFLSGIVVVDILFSYFFNLSVNKTTKIIFYSSFRLSVISYNLFILFINNK